MDAPPLLGIALGVWEIAIVLVFLAAITYVVAKFTKWVFGASQREVSRACPACGVSNIVEHKLLGTGVRCSACGGLLYPEEARGPQVHVNAVGTQISHAPIDGGPAGPQRTVVEREVLVERCAACGQPTPLDLAACRNCGAQRPSGASPVPSA